MLNIGKLAPGGEAYYLSSVAAGVEDYYTGSGEAPGCWAGAGAAAFGLAGEVSAEDLHRLLSGVHPTTGQRLVRPVQRAHPRSLLAADPLRRGLAERAAARGVEVDQLFAADPPAARMLRHSGASTTIAVERAERIATAAALDLVDLYDDEALTDARAHRGQRVDVRVPAFDATLRAPKSVSLLYGLGDASTAEQVRIAHDRAVEQTLGYLQREAGQVRRGHNGVDRASGQGFTVAAFRHRSSRARDPLLHTHCLVANLVQAQDGRWGAVDSAALYVHAKTAGTLYQAALRDGLTRALGIEWGPVVNGCADIAGVPRPVIEAFSRRRTEILERLRERGETSAKAAQVATLDTRSAKPAGEEATSERGMREEWQARGAELGFDRDAIDGLTHRGRTIHIDAPATEEWLLGPEGLTAKASTFTRRHLLQSWCAQLPTGAPVDEVERLADAVLVNGSRAGQVVALVGAAAAATGVRPDVEDLIAAAAEATPSGAEQVSGSVPLRDALAVALDGGWTAERLREELLGQELVSAADPAAVLVWRAQQAAARATGGAARLDERAVLRRGDGWVVAAVPTERRYSTAELLAVEQALVHSAIRRTAEGAAVAGDQQVAVALAARPSIGPDQAAMVERITRSGSGVEVVVGPAGTGKTFALDAARQAWQTSGYRVIGAALAAQARNELQAGTGIDSYTLAALLGQLDDADLLRGRRGNPLDDHTVVVVDEAGMVGSRQLARLLTYAERYGSKVVLVGDDRQLPEIDAGGAFRALQARLDAVELTQNRRQHDPIQRDALTALRSGSAATGVRLLANNDQVTIGSNAEALRTQLVDDWWAARTNGRAGVMIAARNSDVDDLNARARSRRFAAGELVGAEIDTPAGPLQVGDEVIGTRNVPLRAIDAQGGRAQLVNGARGAVIAVDPRQGTVDARMDLGGVERELRINAHSVANGDLRHGYAVTGHKAQGMTTEDVFVLGTDELYREWLYVAMSRGRGDNRLYITGGADTVELPDEASHPQVLGQRRELDAVAGLTQLAGHSHRQQAALDQVRARKSTGLSLPKAATRAPARAEGVGTQWGSGEREVVRLSQHVASTRELTQRAAERRARAERELTTAESGLRRLGGRRGVRLARTALARAAADEQACHERLGDLRRRLAMSEVLEADRSDRTMYEDHGASPLLPNERATIVGLPTVKVVR